MDRSFLYKIVAAVGILTIAQVAGASDEKPACSEDTARVEEISAFAAFEDYSGVHQQAQAAGYTRATCITGTPHRFHVELSAVHVHEPVGHAEAALLGIGVELKPLSAMPGLTIVPLVRIGYEHFGARRGDRFVKGGSMIAEIAASAGTRVASVEGKDVTIAKRQLILGAHIDYLDRRATGAGTSRLYFVASDDRATAGSYFGLDQQLGRTLRGRATGGFEVLGRGSVSHYGYLELALRPVDERHETYRWNYSTRLSLGDGGYRGVLFGISRRFVSPSAAARAKARSMEQGGEK